MGQFLDIPNPNIQGESQSAVPTCNKKIQLDQMRYHILQDPGQPGSGGANVSSAAIGNMTITKSMDRSTPLLFKQLGSQDPITTAYVRVSRLGLASGGATNKAEYEAETYTMTNVRVIHYSTSGAPGVTGLPAETWVLSFSAITETYQTVDVTGALQPAQSVAFDVSQGIVTAAS
jgi:type VI protein secretion system component Hcp